MGQNLGMVIAAIISLLCSSIAAVIFHDKPILATVLWILALVYIALLAYGAYDIGVHAGYNGRKLIEPPEPWPKPEMKDFKPPKTGDVHRRHMKWG